jgi:hypothetical protein
VLGHHLAHVAAVTLNALWDSQTWLIGTAAVP